MIEQSGMSKKEEIVQMADFFKVFGDATRLRILFILQEGEMAVQAVADALGMHQTAISQQLKLLRSSRLVKFRKEGRSIYYSLNDDHIAKILSMGLEHINETHVSP
ncbi:MAG: metalloregulator ArsR/SmtB family transcription factor [Sphaerochaetaceae bacterium]|nr:metalloregulator ArsR/SmtB family transcription factor [Sphaerochaetaceae bacterium]